MQKVITVKLILLLLFLFTPISSPGECSFLFNSKFLNKVNITNEILSLRPIKLTDKLFLANLLTQDDVVRNIDRVDLWEIYALRRDPRAATMDSYFAIWIIEYKGVSIGCIILRKVFSSDIPEEIKNKIKKFLGNTKAPFIASIGYVISPEFRGHGFATTALNMVTEFASNNLRLPLILPTAYKTNAISERVLSNAGYTRITLQIPTRMNWFSLPNIN